MIALLEDELWRSDHLHDDDKIAHRHGIDLVMGNEDGSDAQLLLQVDQVKLDIQ